MHAQLLESLTYLSQETDRQLELHYPSLDHAIEELRKGNKASPSHFGIYYDLADALINGNAFRCAQLIDELALEQNNFSRPLKILSLDQVAPNQKSRFQRMMDTDPKRTILISSPVPEKTQSQIATLEKALGRFRKAIPAMACEFDHLIREVVLVVGQPDLGFTFQSGTTYMLWGALFINLEKLGNDVEIIETFAHECAHSILFGHMSDEPLVWNTEDELFSSPLRDDGRPMDGIYHATYVSARMHWAMSALLASDELNDEEIAIATARKEADRRSFWQGYALVNQHGRLSDTGQLLLQGAYEYMYEQNSNDPVET